MRRLIYVVVLSALIATAGLNPSKPSSTTAQTTRSFYYNHHYNPPPASSPTPPPPAPALTPPTTQAPTTTGSKLCMNYGHQTSTYDLSVGGTVSKDLANMSSHSINCIRTADYGWNSSQTQALAIFAKSKGFYVDVGGDWGTLTPDQEGSYQSQVLQEAAWAQTNHMDQFSIGNEQEGRLSGMSSDQLYSFLETLATAVHRVYGGTVSYEASGDLSDFWAGKSLGSIDKIGLNLYCGYDCDMHYLNENIAAHGLSHVYVSEANADMGTGSYDSDAAHAAEVTGDLVKMESVGVQIYYFAYAACDGSDGMPSYWGLYQCGTLAQPLTAKALGL